MANIQGYGRGSTWTDPVPLACRRYAYSSHHLGHLVGSGLGNGHLAESLLSDWSCVKAMQNDLGLSYARYCHSLLRQTCLDVHQSRCLKDRHLCEEPMVQPHNYLCVLIAVRIDDYFARLSY